MQAMMHCLNPSIRGRQRAQLQWQQQQEEVNNSSCIESFFSLQSEGLGEGWPHLDTSSQYPIAMREKEEMSTNITSATISISTSSVQAGKSEKSSKKRKAADMSPMEISGEEDKKEKRTKEDSGNCSKEKIEDKKPDYILVRARRGQATDSHSLAERVRRERISERMKHLQGLVPGCNKITGKAVMLDEIINYVQSLQRQVEFLSMKLAAVNPRLDHVNMENLLHKEINISCNSTIPSFGTSSELVDPPFNQFNCLLDMVMNQTEPFDDSYFNVQRSSSGWETELHNLYGSAFPFHSLLGNLLPNNVKREL